VEIAAGEPDAELLQDERDCQSFPYRLKRTAVVVLF
jgi:hypothetical protein